MSRSSGQTGRAGCSAQSSSQAHTGACGGFGLSLSTLPRSSSHTPLVQGADQLWESAQADRLTEGSQHSADPAPAMERGMSYNDILEGIHALSAAGFPRCTSAGAGTVSGRPSRPARGLTLLMACVQDRL